MSPPSRTTTHAQQWLSCHMAMMGSARALTRGCDAMV